MTAPTVTRADTEAAVRRLKELAAARLAEEWTADLEAELYALSGQPSREATWRAFDLLVEWIDLRDRVNAGLAHWSEVEPQLTGPDRSGDAYRIACDQVEDAARTLIGGWR